jgi:hypothetical protein
MLGVDRRRGLRVSTSDDSDALMLPFHALRGCKRTGEPGFYLIPIRLSLTLSGAAPHTRLHCGADLSLMFRVYLPR